jgi:hypothetical protein
MKAPRNATKREILADGIYPAILYSLVQIGTVEGYQGKMQNKIRVTFELPTEVRTFDGKDKPMAMGKNMTFSMAPKAGLRKIAESINGKGMTDDEADEFDVEALVGKGLILNIKSKEGENGIFNYIDGFTPLMKGQKLGKPFNEPTVLFFETWDETVFGKLPQFMQEMIKTSDEYRTMKGLKLPSEPLEGEDVTVNADDVPF